MGFRINNPNHYLNPDQHIALRTAALEHAARVAAGNATRTFRDSDDVLKAADKFYEWLMKSA